MKPCRSFWDWISWDGTVNLEQLAKDGQCVAAIGNQETWCVVWGVRQMEEAQ